MNIKSFQSKIVSERAKIQKINKKISEIIVDDEPILKDKLKGDQLTGFVGEYYASRIIDGVNIEPDEKNSYDLIDSKRRIEVKTRIYNPNSASSWKQTSAISEKKILPNGPTHLCFLLLNNDYSVHGVWLFDWLYLIDNDRLKPKTVKGNERAYYFMLRYKMDESFRIY